MPKGNRIMGKRISDTLEIQEYMFLTRENTHIPGKEMVKDQARGHKAVKGTCDGKARPHGSASNTKA